MQTADDDMSTDDNEGSEEVSKEDEGSDDGEDESCFVENIEDDDDEFEALTEDESAQLIVDTAAVCETVSKVCLLTVILLHILIVHDLDLTTFICDHSFDYYCPSCLEEGLQGP